MTITNWFPPFVKPVHIGWYHTSISNKNPSFNAKLESAYNWWWNGKRWIYPINDSNLAPTIQERYWRGIAK